jgi:hypothetical protein
MSTFKNLKNESGIIKCFWNGVLKEEDKPHYEKYSDDSNFKDSGLYILLYEDEDGTIWTDDGLFDDFDDFDGIIN